MKVSEIKLWCKYILFIIKKVTELGINGAMKICNTEYILLINNPGRLYVLKLYKNIMVQQP